MVGRSSGSRCRRLGTGGPRGRTTFLAFDMFDDALPEYDCLHERVACEAVRAMDAGAGHLAASEKPRDSRSAKDVGADSTHQVMGRRRDRDRVAPHFQAYAGTEGVDTRETRCEVH